MQITGNDTETGAEPRGWFTGVVDVDAVVGRSADPQGADRRAAAVRLVRPPARRPRIVWPARGPALASRPTHAGSWERPRAARPAALPR